MNYQKLFLGTMAILVSFVIFNLPIVSATEVNILFAGEVQATTQISTENLVNSRIEVAHDPSDRAYRNVKLTVSISSASMARAVSKILLYKCKDTTPVDCVKGEPLEFETYVDTEIA